MTDNSGFGQGGFGQGGFLGDTAGTEYSGLEFDFPTMFDASPEAQSLAGSPNPFDALGGIQGFDGFGFDATASDISLEGGSPGKGTGFSSDFGFGSGSDLGGSDLTWS